MPLRTESCVSIPLGTLFIHLTLKSYVPEGYGGKNENFCTSSRGKLLYMKVFQKSHFLFYSFIAINWPQLCIHSHCQWVVRTNQIPVCSREACITNGCLRHGWAGKYEIIILASTIIWQKWILIRTLNHNNVFVFLFCRMKGICLLSSRRAVLTPPLPRWNLTHYHWHRWTVHLQVHHLSSTQDQENPLWHLVIWVPEQDQSWPWRRAMFLRNVRSYFHLHRNHTNWTCIENLLFVMFIVDMKYAAISLEELKKDKVCRVDRWIKEGNRWKAEHNTMIIQVNYHSPK